MVTLRTVPLDLSMPGTVVPYASVSVRALVSGELQSVGFQQGKAVSKGQLLFQIDPRPYQAALAQALAIQAKDTAQIGQLAANLARDAVTRANALTEARRYAALVRQGYVSREQAEQYQVAAQAANATVAADRAALQAARASLGVDRAGVATARINLGYTRITAPFSGIAGSLGVDPGNVIKANDATPLVTLEQMRPIYVEFPLQESQFELVRRYAGSGAGIAVQARPADDPGAIPEVGRFAFTDNAIDATTGTLQARAIFPDTDGKLWPGTYVNVKVHLADEPDRVVVPEAAVQTGQAGQYVYVIGRGDRVARRPVTIARTQGDRAIVKEGLSAGLRVVTDGQLQLFDGAKVKIVQREASASARAGASR